MDTTRTVLVRSALIGSLALGIAGAPATAAAQEEISFFVIGYNDPGLGVWWQKVVEAYETNTGNTVSIRNTTAAEYYQQVTVEAASGAGADILIVNIVNLRELVPAGLLRPLNDFVERPGVRDRLVDGAWETLSVDGQYYALPITGRTLELIYNECYFKEAGVDAPPTTPEEYLETARKLTVRDASGNVVRFGANMVNAHEDPTYEMLLMWTIAYGGFFGNDAGEFTMTSEPVVKALTLMKALYDEGLVPRGATETEQRALFATGKSAMTIDGQWQFPFIEENNKENFHCYKSAKHPWDGPATGGVNQALAINASSTKAEAAWAFLETAMSPEMQAIFGDHSPFIPYGRNALTLAQLEARPYLKPWMESIGTASPITLAGHEDEFNTMWPIVADGVLLSLRDGIDPAEALATVQQELEECCQ